MNTIIRLQDKDGRGIYSVWLNRIKNEIDPVLDTGDAARHPTPRRDSLLRYNAPSLFDAARHPTPRRDLLLRYNAPSLFNNYGYFTASDFVFGFTNKQQARSWIFSDSTLKLLETSGVKVYIMSGEIYEGNAQAVINNKTAKIVEEYTISEFFGLTE